jgi:type I site-specific restriction endonuclease
MRQKRTLCAMIVIMSETDAYARWRNEPFPSGSTTDEVHADLAYWDAMVADTVIPIVDEEELFREYPSDFLDLLIVDECHRGSASPTSSWRAVLEHFAPAVQLGLTATPKRDTNVDTYDYFGNPIFEYSLRQGI